MSQFSSVMSERLKTFASVVKMILKIVRDFRFPGDCVASVNLRESAEALTHGIAPALFGGS